MYTQWVYVGKEGGSQQQEAKGHSISMKLREAPQDMCIASTMSRDSKEECPKVAVE